MYVSIPASVFRRDRTPVSAPSFPSRIRPEAVVGLPRGPGVARSADHGLPSAQLPFRSRDNYLNGPPLPIRIERPCFQWRERRVGQGGGDFGLRVRPLLVALSNFHALAAGEAAPAAAKGAAHALAGVPARGDLQ